jgi:hypothetical protein
VTHHDAREIVVVLLLAVSGCSFLASTAATDDHAGHITPTCIPNRVPPIVDTVLVGSVIAASVSVASEPPPTCMACGIGDLIVIGFLAVVGVPAVVSMAYGFSLPTCVDDPPPRLTH